MGAARLVPPPSRLEWSTVWPWAFWALWGGWLAVSDLLDENHLQPALAVLMRISPGYEFDAGNWLLPPLPALVGGFLGRSMARGAGPRKAV